MASNPFGDLYKQMATTAAYNNSQYGSTGNKIFDFLAPIVSAVTNAQQAYNSGQDRGLIFPALQGVTQSLSKRNFLNNQASLQQEALRQQQLTKSANNNLLNRVVGGQQFGLTGEEDPEYAMKLGLPYLERVGGVTNYLNSGQGGLGAIEGGFGTLPTPNFQNGQPQPVNITPQMTGTSLPTVPSGQPELESINASSFGDTLNPGDSPKLFQLGDSRTAPMQSWNPALNPYYYGATDVPSNVAMNQRSGFEGAGKQQGLMETNRSNIENEATRAKLAQIQQQNADTDKQRLQAQIDQGYFTHPQPANNMSQSEFLSTLYSPEELRSAGYGLPDQGNQIESATNQVKLINAGIDDINSRRNWLQQLSPEDQAQLQQLQAAKQQLIQSSVPNAINIQRGIQETGKQGAASIPSFRQFQQGNQGQR